MQGFYPSAFFSQVSANNTFPNTFPQLNISTLLLDLQETMKKQEMVLNLLLQQQQQNHYFDQLKQQSSSLTLIDSKMTYGTQSPEVERANILTKNSSETSYSSENAFFENDNSAIKMEDFFEQTIKREVSSETAPQDSFEALKESETDEFLPSQNYKPFKIIRRNGFKETTNEEDSSEEQAKMKRKSNKFIDPKCPPSKSKHLWINYGRKIVEFAMNQTREETKARIKLLVGKLVTKKDFKKVFRVLPSDSESDKAFKVLFGKIALFFVENKVEEGFRDSKYKDQLIRSKKVVSSLISKMIDC